MKRLVRIISILRSIETTIDIFFYIFVLLPVENTFDYSSRRRVIFDGTGGRKVALCFVRSRNGASGAITRSIDRTNGTFDRRHWDG